MRQKIVAAKYGFDLARREEPPGGWEDFKARSVEEVSRLKLYTQDRKSEEPVEKYFKAGRIAAASDRSTLDLWVLDTVQHFSQITDDGLDLASSMSQIQRIAEEYQVPVLVTARALTDEEGEEMSIQHVPSAVARGAETVLELHRNGIYWTSGPHAKEATVRVLKSPRVEVGASCPLLLEPSYCRFTAPSA